MNNLVGKKGQMAIFVIVAILVVTGIVAYFAFRGGFEIGGIPEELQPVYSYYLECIEDETESALNLAGNQGGRIDTGEYIPGSEYAPFSNQLNFLGFPVPYWYYISGNGLIKENVPAKSDIEKEIETYLEENLGNCNFEQFYEGEYYIEFDKPNVDVRIGMRSVDVQVNNALVVTKGEETARKSSHSVSVDSKFGSFYNTAINIYEGEKDSEFLENYGVDVLRLYAPVDGVEIQCSPKVWKTREVIDKLKDALEANVLSIRADGKDSYFSVDGLKEDESVQFMYSRSWPTRVEVSGDGVNDELMVAEVIGAQEGMGIMGFCYAPYHFVYDISYPVIVQIYNEEEVFQFPIAVIIDNNVPREALFAEGFDYLADEDFDLCEFKDKNVAVNVYDVNLNKVDADVSYECFTQTCSLGETENGRFVGESPACVNGYLKLRAEGFKDKEQLFSTNSEVSAEVIMDREHEVYVELSSGGKSIEDNTLVIFTNEGGESVSAYFPDVKSVKLSEGQYTLSVYVYSDSSIVMPASTKTQCQDVVRSGILGLFGTTKEECFEIKVPETKIENALSGGGKEEVYILESELQKGKVILDVVSFGEPTSLDDLYSNFLNFDSYGVRVSFE